MGWPGSIDDEVGALPNDPTARLSIRKHARHLTNTVQRMNTIIGKGSIKQADLKGWCRGRAAADGGAGARNWLEALADLQAAFVDAINAGDKAKLKEVFGEVSSCLPPTLSGLNTQLKEAVNQLNLRSLIGAMEKVCNVLIKLDPKRTEAKVRSYQKGIDDLQKLGERLRDLKEQHDRWQKADTKLGMFSNLLDSYTMQGREAAPVLELFLSALATEIEPLYKESAADWATELKKSAEDTRAALDKRDEHAATESFHTYNAFVAFRFYELDSEMKAQCDELSNVGEELEKVDKELESI
jgi:hypothetical protein